jgi:hypothetical protein
LPWWFHHFPSSDEPMTRWRGAWQLGTEQPNRTWCVCVYLFFLMVCVQKSTTKLLFSFESTTKFHDRLIIKFAQSSNIHKAIIKHDHINRSHEKHYQKALDLHNSDMNYHRLWISIINHNQNPQCYFNINRLSSKTWSSKPLS